jgi:hypothetical protein
MIFIVHTMHDSRCYLKMGSPDAYGARTGIATVGRVLAAFNTAVQLLQAM